MLSTKSKKKKNGTTDSIIHNFAIRIGIDSYNYLPFEKNIGSSQCYNTQ